MRYKYVHVWGWWAGVSRAARSMGSVGLSGELARHYQDISVKNVLCSPHSHAAADSRASGGRAVNLLPSRRTQPRTPSPTHSDNNGFGSKWLRASTSSSRPMLRHALTRHVMTHLNGHWDSRPPDKPAGISLVYAYFFFAISSQCSPFDKKKSNSEKTTHTHKYAQPGIQHSHI